MILCICLISTNLVEAQILNINKLDITTDSSGYFTGNFDLTFDYDNRSPLPDEKVTYLGLESGFDLVFVADKHAYFLIAQLNHYRTTGDPVISTGYGHFRINFNRKNRISFESYAQSLFDHSRHLDHRFLLGGDVKIRLVNSGGIELDLGIGALYENEKWRDLERDGSYTYNSLIRASNYFKMNILLTENSVLSFVTFYQVGHDRDADLWRNRISGLLQLEIDMNDSFSFIVEGSISHEHRPVIPILPTIYGVSNGFRFSF